MSGTLAKWVKRLLVLVACAAVLYFVATWLMSVSPVAREVIVGGLGLLASIFTSPFILEASLAFIGFVIVISYNQRKLEREGKDEWVLLPKEEPATSPDSPAGSAGSANSQPEK